MLSKNLTTLICKKSPNEWYKKKTLLLNAPISSNIACFFDDVHAMKHGNAQILLERRI